MIAVRKCAICGTEFTAHSANKKYCSKECRVASERARYKHKEAIKKTCPVCGREFKTKRNDAKYCSTACQIKDSNARKKERAKTGEAKKVETMQQEGKGPFRPITEEWADNIRYWHEELGDSPEYLAAATGRDISIIKKVLKGELP